MHPALARSAAGPATAALLLAGLAGATAVRVGLAGAEGPADATAGCVGGAALLVLAVLAGRRPSRPSWRGVLAGVGAGVLLTTVPAALWWARDGDPPPLHGLPRWVVVVVAVAVCQEVFFRGALLDALLPHGDVPAVVVTAVAFGLMHAPLHGWGAVPLDVAVGLVLGGLRLATGGLAAPAAAHAVADVLGWWLR